MDQAASLGRIGRYVIQGELGRGAMGVVYRAQDPAIGRTLAIKTIRIGQFSDQREIQHVRDRMVREAQAAGILSHSNIVTIYDIQEDAGTVYIFMEYVEGDTLEKVLLADTPVEPKLILRIARQSAEALDYAHARGIVHRDIKPANIMVHRDGTAKIADFGIARMQSQSMTQTGQILGTPNYMPPEQIAGKVVDGRADQYSLAVMLYEVFTGEKPFIADSLPTLLFKVVSEAPIPAPRLNPTLSPQIDDVLQRALAKNPNDRYPTCGEFIRSLEQACADHPGWTTLVRGGGMTQPTQPVAVPAPPTPAKPIPVAVPHAVAPKPDPAPEPQPEPAPKPEPAPFPPAPVRPEPRPEVAKSDSKTNLVAAVVAAILLLSAAAGGWFYFQGPAEAPVATTPAANEPKTDPAPVAEVPATKKAIKDSPLASGQNEPAPGTAPPVAPVKPDSSAQLAAVSIQTNPEGVKVILDDGKLPPCTSPCLVEMSRGRHTATFTLDNYKSQQRIFNVPTDSSLAVTMEHSKGILEVNSTPAGATVSIDGVEQPQKTPAFFPLVVGKHTVTVTLPGKPPYNRSFEMRADGNVSLHPDWGN